MPLLDIFSRKPIKSKKEKDSRIYIDYREKKSLVPSELISLNQTVSFDNLKIGDYQVNNLIIERKTISDLKSSIINKRIFSQIENMKLYPEYLLIIEGFQETPYNSKIISDNAFRGFIISITTKNKIPLIFTENEKDTAKYIAMLAKNKSKQEISIRYTPKIKTDKERVRYILEGFENIGPIKSKELLNKFKNLKNIFNANEEQIKEILGIKAEEFLRILNQEIN